MTTDNCYRIGLIKRPHGLKGEVTIALDDDAPDNFEAVKTVFIEVNEKLLPYFIENVSMKGNRAFMKLEDIDTPEAAEEISRSAIYLPKASRPKSGRGEFYDDEVIGFEVVDNDLGLLGTIADVVKAGGNRLLSVQGNGREILIPLNAPFIESVNKSRKRISVTLPEGFVDI